MSQLSRIRSGCTGEIAGVYIAPPPPRPRLDHDEVSAPATALTWFWLPADSLPTHAGQAGRGASRTITQIQHAQRRRSRLLRTRRSLSCPRRRNMNSAPGTHRFRSWRIEPQTSACEMQYPLSMRPPREGDPRTDSKVSWIMAACSRFTRSHALEKTANFRDPRKSCTVLSYPKSKKTVSPDFRLVPASPKKWCPPRP